MADIDTANADTLLEMGPIDYIVLEWPGRQPDGSVAPLILELVDRGLIRILDIAFLGKDEDGSAYAVDIADIDAAEAFGVFDGASSGLLRRGGPRGGRARCSSPAPRRPCSCGRTLGGPGRRRDSQVGRPAGRQRPHPRPGPDRVTRRARGRRLIERNHECQDFSAG